MNNTPKSDTTVSKDKEFEYVTSQIIKHIERTVDAFKMFTKLFSAIVGGSILLSTQQTIGPESARTYAHLADALVFLVTLISGVMIVEDYRAWWGFRRAQTTLVPHVPPPSWRARVTEWVMILCMVLGCGLFWWFNPFTLPHQK